MGNAPVYVGPNDASDSSDDGLSYRERKVLAMVDAHDRRLRAVVDLARRDGRSYQSLVRLSVQLFWNTMSDSSSGGYASYTTTGVGCLRGEAQKKRSWEKAMKRKLAEGYDDMEFVPFSIEVGGVWGPAARRFFDECLDAAHTDRDIDFYHWSSQSFGDFWKDALSVLMARERARIGLAASKGDWPRRIAAYARDEQEDAAAYADS